MPGIAITTTPASARIGGATHPSDIVVHAYSKNTDTILVSWTTGDVSQFEEIAANESVYLYSFVGDIYAMANSGTQYYTIQVTSTQSLVVKP